MRIWLVIGGLVAAGLGVALWLLVRTDDEAPARTAAPSRDRPPIRTADSSDRPTMPRTHADGSATPSHDYAVGDVVVRDHRAGDQLQRTEPPIDRQSRTRLLPASLTKAISQKVLAVMTDCTASVPADAGTDKARLDGDVTVSIKDHTLTVSRAAVALGNLTRPALDAAKQCIEQRSVGLQTAAADQDDLENYKISVSFRLP